MRMWPYSAEIIHLFSVLSLNGLYIENGKSDYSLRFGLLVT